MLAEVGLKGLEGLIGIWINFCAKREAYIIAYNKRFGGVFKAGIQGSFDGIEDAFVTSISFDNICFNGVIMEGLFEGEFALFFHTLFLFGCVNDDDCGYTERQKD